MGLHCRLSLLYNRLGFRFLDYGRRLLRIERGFEIGTAIGAETDAAGQLLSATVAKLGFVLGRGTRVGSMAVRGIGVVTDNERAVLVTAHGKALWTHDLAVMYHQLLLGYGHPFTTLWALEFHNLLQSIVLDVGAKIML